ncbi:MULTISPECIES: hypothetical protein [unclassified Synechococcus]|uniref:hypothetical protein n=1 Tax=unclassified Synechococcus TaxID=2626047 RepID=UPI0039AF76D7
MFTVAAGLLFVVEKFDHGHGAAPLISEPMDDSSAGFGDLADSPYFPRYGAGVCYASTSSRRTTK